MQNFRTLGQPLQGFWNYSGQINRQTNGQTNRRMNERLDRLTDEQQMKGWMANEWTNELTNWRTSPLMEVGAHLKIEYDNNYVLFWMLSLKLYDNQVIRYYPALFWLVLKKLVLLSNGSIIKLVNILKFIFPTLKK